MDCLVRVGMCERRVYMEDKDALPGWFKAPFGFKHVWRESIPRVKRYWLFALLAMVNLLFILYSYREEITPMITRLLFSHPSTKHTARRIYRRRYSDLISYDIDCDRVHVEADDNEHAMVYSVPIFDV